jgi:hypothetical protein
MHGNGIGTSEEPAGFLFSRTRTLLAWGILRLLLFVSRTSLSLFFLLFVSLSLDSSWWTFYSSREIVHIVCFYVGRPIYCLISICYFFCLTGFVTAALLFSINKYLFFSNILLQIGSTISSDRTQFLLYRGMVERRIF